jgi:hypothetical protein
MSDNNSAVPFDLDSGTLDDITDLPGFGAFPTGAYRICLKEGIEFKKINEHPAMQVQMEMKEVLELDPKNLEENEEPPKAEDVATVAFLMDNEIGAGFYKNFAAPIYKHLGVSSHKEAISQSKGLELIVALKRIHGKGDKKDQTFNQFINIGIA